MAKTILIIFCCLITVYGFYEFPYGDMNPAFDSFGENYNSHFVHPFMFDESNEEEDGDKLFNNESLDEFEPVKRSEINKMPQFHGESAVKRDLIKGPSFQPNINEDDADSDIVNENKEAFESLLAKRKDIFLPNSMESDDDVVQGKDLVQSTDNNVSTMSPTESSTTPTVTNEFLKGIQNDINKVHNQVTKHVIHIDYNDDETPTSESNNNTETDNNNNSNDKKLLVTSDHDNNNLKHDTDKKLEMTKNLIGLLYDFDDPPSENKESLKTRKQQAIKECK